MDSKASGEHEGDRRGLLSGQRPTASRIYLFPESPNRPITESPTCRPSSCQLPAASCFLVTRSVCFLPTAVSGIAWRFAHGAY